VVAGAVVLVVGIGDAVAFVLVVGFVDAVAVVVVVGGVVHLPLRRCVVTAAAALAELRSLSRAQSGPWLTSWSAARSRVQSWSRSATRSWACTLTQSTSRSGGAS
jgi:hypothetical protein